MITGTRVRVLENPADLAAGAFLATVNFYDDKGRVVQVQTENLKGGTDIITNRYDFSGKVLSSYLEHNNSSAQQVRVKTNMEYDHAGRLLETWKTINDDATKKALIAKNEYDELGQLKRKELGKKKDANGDYTSEPLEKLDYTYNIRGWLKGINRYYAAAHINYETDRWFGMELAYDWGFENNQVNGNIAGTKWRSKGDGEQRAYGFGYDKANRLLSADFNQYTAGWNKDAGINFSSYMGDGIDPTSAYDANGNILAMKQWGLKGSASDVIDDLTYDYVYQGNDYTNKLRSVSESATINSVDHKLGDFTDKNLSGDDYSYDANGNLTGDKNKEIGIIQYNHLNLPYYIDKDISLGYGSIEYVYDATGNKLRKMVRDGTTTSRKTIVTEYISGFIYEGEGGEAGPDPQDIKLQFFGHEEGRVRYVAPSSVHPEKWVYDYFVKDHLGNTRLVLTDDQQVDQYPAATMEDGMANEEETYYQNLETSRSDKPSNYPNDTYTDPNLKAAKLEGDINRIGPAIILRVMAGDKINLRVNSWYDHNGTPLNIDIGPVRDEIVNALVNGIPAKSGGKLGTGSLTSGILNPGIMAFLNDRENTSDDQKAQAFVNVLLLNDQFKPVITGDGKNTWTEQVGADGEFKEHILEGREMTMNGYLYIYVSNETHHQPVFFDNLQVTHIRGPLLEETHYYPFGLTMGGINSKALSFGSPQNKSKFGGKELQSGEFSDGSGLETYDFLARNYDPQIGRFHQLDPFAEISRRWSPYVYSANNPIRYNDPDGMVWGDPEKDGKIAKRLQDRIAQRLKDENGNLEKASNKYSEIASKIEKEGTSKKLEKQLKNAADDVASAVGAISELQNSSIELTEMGSADTKQVFTFKEITGSEGGTEKKADGVIEMSITGDANGVHEAKHGYILHSEGPRTRDNFYSHEVRAYTAQYAFDAATVQNNVPSYWGNVKSPSDITVNWVIGIHNGSGGTIGDFIYAKQLMGASYDPKFIMKFLNEERKKK